MGKLKEIDALCALFELDKTQITAQPRAASGYAGSAQRSGYVAVSQKERGTARTSEKIQGQVFA